MKLTGLALVPVLALAGIAAAPAAAPHVLIVAPGGSDSGTGSTEHPLRTVDAAIQRLRGGGSVELRGGTYHQRIVLDHAEGITVMPYRHEHVVLSGAGIAPPDGRSAMVTVVDSSRVTVRDLDITGYVTQRITAMPIGVYVHGYDDRVRILGLHVHDEGNDNGTLGSFDINAHGIAAYGDDPHRPISRLEIRGNTLDHLRLGASETVVVNGNVDHWAITGNRIHDDNNIGIDAIGFEPTISGDARYSEVNRARDGVISGNVVSRIRSQGNPAYWQDGSWCDCADGIYVDGGTRIRISGNRSDGNDIGIEVAAENARGNASHVTVDHNSVTGQPLHRHHDRGLLRRRERLRRGAHRVVVRQRLRRQHVAREQPARQRIAGAARAVLRARRPLRAQRHHGDERRPSRLRHGGQSEGRCR